MSSTAPPSQNNDSTTVLVTTPNGYRLPENTTLQHAAKLSIVEDKPIMLDYWTNSLDKTVLIGVKDNKEKLLVKSEEEIIILIVYILHNKIYKSRIKESKNQGNKEINTQR